MFFFLEKCELLVNFESDITNKEMFLNFFCKKIMNTIKMYC